MFEKEKIKRFLMVVTLGIFVLKFISAVKAEWNELRDYEKLTVKLTLVTGAVVVSIFFWLLMN